MRYVFFGFFLLTITLVPVALLRRSFPGAWERWIKRAAGAAGLSALTGAAVWKLGALVGAPAVGQVGLTVTAVLMVAGWLLFTSSLVWAPAAAVVRRLERPGGGEPPDPSRRSFLQGAVGTVPASAAIMSPLGTAAAMAEPVLTRVDVPVEGLSEALDGLKILQLTDIHLGTWIDPDQVRRAIDIARPHAPDLVVLTGDLADDMDKLAPALKEVEALKAPLGAFACIGNHEIYRGRQRFEAILGASAVTLLTSEGRLLRHRGATLWLGGADDPARLGPDASAFLSQTVERAMAGCPADVGASILMSHRPEGFDAAAERGVTLTLAGHTHGGQVAMGGRSVFEGILPGQPYLLGLYKRGASHLYTSAGLGHWLPFRVGCPCEAALITLRRA